MPTTDLSRTDDLLRAQWLRLRRWIGALDEDTVARPSVLPGWSVADLVAHLGRSLDALAACQPADVPPLTLGEYLGGYAARADRIDQVTRELAQEFTADPLAGVDRLAEGAFAQLLDLRRLGPDPVVQGRAGALHLSDMVLTRLVELVVHGDDLARSAPHVGGDALDGEAVAVVAQALLDVVQDEDGGLEVADALLWTRLACGREPVDAPAVAAAVRPTSGTGSPPDLTAVLPVL